MTAKTQSGGYKTGTQAKNRHFSRIDNSVHGGGWEEIRREKSPGEGSSQKS